MKNEFRSAINASRLALLLGMFCLSSAHGQSITNPIAQLKRHILGTTNLTAAQIVAQGNSIQSGITQVGTNAVALAAALDLVVTFDASTNKPLFTVGSTTYNGFTRDGAGKELAQALFDLQQGILDYTYNPANLVTYYTQLNNTKFATSTYFPGAVAPPANTNQGYAVQINASVLEDWGAPAMYQTWGTRRPTGCYLAPGSIGYVTVPAALVNKGYSVRVGAHYWDLSAKTTVERLDRVSLVYPITSATTRIANPLGGGIYIEVPYKITNGIVTVGLTNVVRSPLFRATSFDQTTAAEWLTERTQPGPWADFESDKFMMQVPRKWIYNYTNAVKVMQDWDGAMDVVSDLMGRNRVRSKTVLYLQVDVAYRGTANFPGYPQSNINYDMNTVESGNKNHYLLTGPQNSDYAVLHELGHAELFTKFTGEQEAAVNLNYVAVQNQKFGMSLGTAFGRSMGGSANANVGLPQAAMTWILIDSFRAGATMTASQMAYQHRGYGKYVEIANLFGWGALSNFWHSVNVDYMNGIDYPENSDPTDSRILRMSKAAGVDLRPLIHFWGVKPVNAATLKTSIQNAGLPPSALIYNRLKYYQTVVPTNLTQLTALYADVANTVSDGDRPWYTNMLANFDPTDCYATISKVQEIIDLYFPTGLPTGTLSNTPATVLTANSAALKATLGCNGNSYSVQAFWNTVNGATNAALWTNSAFVGSWTNVVATNLTFTASGLTPGRTYYYTFRATNAYQTLWATNVLSFTIAPAFDWSGATSSNMSGTPANWGGTVPAATDIARWNAATYTNAPSANANMTLGQLLFDAGNTGGVTFGPGNATLTLNGLAGTGLQMNNGSGTVNTGGARFALGANQKWSNNDNSLLTVGGAISNNGFVLTLDGVGSTSLNGVISGAGDLVVGNGTNTLGGANIYTGDTIISSGTLRLGAGNVLPDGSGYGNVTNNGRLDLNTFSETINGLTGAGTVDTVAGGTPTLNVGGNNQSSTFSGVITDTAGTLSLNKMGNGTLTLGGNNAYGGLTTISAGTLQLGNGGAAGSLTGTTGIANNANLTINRNNAFTQATDLNGQAITGNGSFTQAGAGTTTLSLANSYNGGTFVNAGILQLNVSGAAGTGTIHLGETSGSDSAEVRLAGTGTNPGNDLNVRSGSSGTKTLANRSANSVTYVGNITANDDLSILAANNGGRLTVSGTACTIATGKTVSFSNTGTSGSAMIDSALWGGDGKITYTSSTAMGFSISGAKTYTGGATLNAMSGDGILVATTSSTGPANAPTSGSFGTGTLTLGDTKMRGGNVTDITIANAITFSGNPTFTTVASEKSLIFTGDAALGASRTLTVDTGSTDTSKYVEFQGAISGATFGITKAGAGKLVLSGANSYTGNTTVNAGTLAILNPTLATNSSVIVTNGAVLQLGFAVTNPVAALVLNGTNQVAGVYSSNNVPAYLSGPGSLQVGSIAPVYPPATLLTNHLSSTTLSLSWPADQGWRLEYQTNALTLGLDTNWVEAVNSSVNSTNIMIDPNRPTVFYRLVFP